MTREFVPYELAVKLKKLGFDEPCFGSYRGNYQFSGHLDIEYSTINNLKRYEWLSPILAPLFQQAFRWFREEYDYCSYIKEDIKGSYRFYIEKFDEKFFNSDIINSYEEAKLACLDKLIEIATKQQEQ